MASVVSMLGCQAMKVSRALCPKDIEPGAFKHAGSAKTGNALIVPSNMADISTLIAGAMSVVKAQTP